MHDSRPRLRHRIDFSAPVVCHGDLERQHELGRQRWTGDSWQKRELSDGASKRRNNRRYVRPQPNGGGADGAGGEVGGSGVIALTLDEEGSPVSATYTRYVVDEPGKNLAASSDPGAALGDLRYGWQEGDPPPSVYEITSTLDMTDPENRRRLDEWAAAAAVSFADPVAGGALAYPVARDLERQSSTRARLP